MDSERPLAVNMWLSLEVGHVAAFNEHVPLDGLRVVVGWVNGYIGENVVIAVSIEQHAREIDSRLRSDKEAFPQLLPY